MTRRGNPNSEQKQPRLESNTDTQIGRLRFRQRYILTAGLLGALVVGILAIYALTQQETGPPTETAAPTQLATEVPPTEPPLEVELQQQLRDWFTTVDGVESVLSLDVDLSDDEPPLIYAEIEITQGDQDTRIPNTFMAQVNQMLNTTQYSDFVIIINDGTQIVEYSLNLENAGWKETVLASATLSAPELN